ncbi:fluoride efflux transporter CrcB [Bacillus sp. 1NLA3E]|uniref:fluoride efflux transporter CrcB n=1 Tax=Bacillus sp. 1NLA3E TaxID=666686 RepID=UPI000247F09E|nr:fluoride efflux transporter CrcB [Bacillus sp. 1NLA3E]
MNVILVMFGGFLGAISRFLLGNWSFLHSTYGFPTGTLIINLVGSLLLGWLVANYRDQYPRIFLFFGTGFIGSFTTFSTFSVETLNLLEKGKLGLALGYGFISLVAGICFALIGYKLGLLALARKGRLA